LSNQLQKKFFAPLFFKKAVKDFTTLELLNAAK